LVLDDNRTGNPTVSSQSRIFGDTRTGDGGFQEDALGGEHKLSHAFRRCRL